MGDKLKISDLSGSGKVSSYESPMTGKIGLIKVLCKANNKDFFVKIV